MIEIKASTILNAIEGGDIESEIRDGQIVILLDLLPLLRIPFDPGPQVSVGAVDTVRVMNADRCVAMIAADSREDAEKVADALAELIETAR